MQPLRVPIHRFKYNMRPLIEAAKAGQQVIVTCAGTDDFRIVPCALSGPPPVSPTPIDPALYKDIDTDAPAFASWEKE